MPFQDLTDAQRDAIRRTAEANAGISDPFSTAVEAALRGALEFATQTGEMVANTSLPGQIKRAATAIHGVGEVGKRMLGPGRPSAMSAYRSAEREGAFMDPSLVRAPRPAPAEYDYEFAPYIEQLTPVALKALEAMIVWRVAKGMSRKQAERGAMQQLKGMQERHARHMPGGKAELGRLTDPQGAAEMARQGQARTLAGAHRQGLLTGPSRSLAHAQGSRMPGDPFPLRAGQQLIPETTGQIELRRLIQMSRGQGAGPLPSAGGAPAAATPGLAPEHAAALAALGRGAAQGAPEAAGATQAPEVVPGAAPPAAAGEAGGTTAFRSGPMGPQAIKEAIQGELATYPDIRPRTHEMVRDYWHKLRATVQAETVRTQHILNGTTFNQQTGKTERRHPPMTAPQLEDLIFAMDLGVIEFLESGDPGHLKGKKGNLFRAGDTTEALADRMRGTPAVAVGRALMTQMDTLRAQLYSEVIGHYEKEREALKLTLAEAEAAGDTAAATRLKKQIKTLTEKADAAYPAFIEEAYIPHFYTGWERLDEAQRKAVATAFRQKNPLDKARTYETMEAAEELSGGTLKPRFKNVAEYIQLHRELHTSSVRGRMFMEELKEFEDDLGVQLISKERPSNKWHQSDHWFFHFYRDMPFKKGMHVYVHPALWDYAKSIFETRWTGKGAKVLGAMAAVNRWDKRIRTMISPFHAYALAISGVASEHGGRPTAGAIAHFADSLYRADMKLSDPEWIRDAVGHGLMLGDPMDVATNWRGRLLSAQEMGGKKGAVARATRYALTPLRMMDAGTWDIMYKRGKVVTYNNLVEQLAKQKPGMTEASRKRLAASMTNDIMGGLDWQNLGPILRDPKIQQLLRATWFAPDWTAATIRQNLRAFVSIGGGPADWLGGAGGAAPPGGGPPGGPGGPGLPPPETQGQLYNQASVELGQRWLAKYIWRVGMTWTIIHAANTYSDTGKVELPWENADNRRRYEETGNPKELLRIYAGKDASGTAHYVYPEKQLQEGLGWVYNPLGTIYAKLAAVVRDSAEAATGYQLQLKGGPAQALRGKSLFEAKAWPIRPDATGVPLKGLQLKERLRHVAEQRRPFFMRQPHQPEGVIPGVSPGFGAVTTSTGLAPGRAQGLTSEIIDGIVANGPSKEANKRLKTIREAMKFNGFEEMVPVPESIHPDKRMWRSEYYQVKRYAQLGTKYRAAFWRSMAYESLGDAKKMVPAMRRLDITRDQMIRYLTGTSTQISEMVRTGRFEMELAKANGMWDLHGRMVPIKNFKEAFSWFTAEPAVERVPEITSPEFKEWLRR